MLVLSACHQPPADPAPKPSNTTIDKVWLVETSGLVVRDTSVVFSAASGRTIVLRHALPDNAIFATLEFLPDSTRARDSVHVSVQPTPGQYGFILMTNDKLSPGARATFSYALHFRTPSDAAVKYPSPERFEQLVFPALITADSKVQLLVGQRPAADMLRFPLAGAGRYAAVAAR